MWTSLALSALMSLSVMVQSWRYDPQQKAVVLLLVNASNKDVTAFSISITVTYADGSSDYTDGRPNSAGGHMEDLLGGFLHPQASGNGAFAPGTIRDVILPQAKAISNVDAFVDMVVYADSTAESTNDLMLKEIFAQRTGSLLAMQHTNEIIKRVLADPTVTSPIAEVVKELSAELARFRDEHPNWRPDVPDEIPGLESAREVFASTLRMQREPMDLKKQTERLTNYVSGTEGEIEALKPHTKLKQGSAQ
jgi:hypothetical protein